VSSSASPEAAAAVAEVAIEAAGSATPHCFAGPDDIATLNYTGGTTGKSKGALRYHREYAGFASAILADFEIPDPPRYLTVAPISHVAPAREVSMLFAALIGALWLKEGFTLPRLAGAASVVLGIAALKL